MNSRARRVRSHKEGVKVGTLRRAYDRTTEFLSRSEGAKAEVAESMNQAEQRGAGQCFIPMIENAIERALALDDGDNDAEDDRHRQQCGNAAGKAEAAERREESEDDHSQAKADEHLRRSHFLR
jgi:hypothetical protein